MRIGALITARLKSIRLPKKIVLDVEGREFIAWMIDRLKQCKILDEIVIATSTNPQDDELCQIAKRENVKCFRGSEDDVLERLYGAAVQNKLDFIISATADIPLVSYDFIEQVIDEYKRTNADLINTFDLPHGFSFYGIKVSALKKVLEIKDESETEVWGRYFTESGLFKVINMNTPHELIRRNYRLTLDYPADFDFFKALFESLGPDIYKKPTAEIIAFLDSHPEIVAINQSCRELFQKGWNAKNRPLKLKPIADALRKEAFSKLKIGIIGMGSIGRRHARTLQTIGIDKIYALRTKSGTLKELPDDLKHINEIYDEEEFYAIGLDGVIIANPSSMHIATLKKALEKKLAVLVEKPLANSLEELKEIEGLDASRVVVGFELRHDDLINAVKGFIDSGNLGKICKADIYCGQYLPSWHPYADYRKEYYARKDMGGGAIRTLSHELDLMNYFFSMPKELVAVVEKSSGLEIDVDDSAHLICKGRDGITIHVEVDFLNTHLSRKGAIFGSQGVIEYDYFQSKVVFTDNQGKPQVIFEAEKPGLDKAFLGEIHDFIRCIRAGVKPRSSFEDGKNVMEIIAKAELSTQTKAWESLN